MNYISLLALFLGILLSFLVYIVGNRIVRVYVSRKLKDRAPFFVPFADDSVRMITVLLSIFIFLMVISNSLSISYTNILERIFSNISVLLPKIFVIILILFISWVFIKIISTVTKKIRHTYAPALTLFLQSILIIAAVLTVLEYLGVKATPFLDLFRAVIYTVGLTVAISLGIAIGLVIQQTIKNIVYGKKKK